MYVCLYVCMCVCMHVFMFCLPVLFHIVLKILGLCFVDVQMYIEKS